MAPSFPRPSPPPHVPLPPWAPGHRGGTGGATLGATAGMRAATDVLVGIAIVVGLVGLCRRRCRRAADSDDDADLLAPPKVTFARADSFMTVESELGELELVDAFSPPDSAPTTQADALCTGQGEARPAYSKKKGTRLATASESDDLDELDLDLSPPGAAAPRVRTGSVPGNNLRRNGSGKPKAAVHSARSGRRAAAEEYAVEWEEGEQLVE